MSSHRWILVLAAGLIFGSVTLACEFSVPIWTPDKSADRLYRFLRNGNAGYINSSGEIVVPPTLKYSGNILQAFHDGRMPVYDFTSETGLNYYYVGPDGRHAIPTTFRFASDFSEGLAVVALMEGIWGYIDVHGRFVITPRFDNAQPVSEGLAAVEIKERWGYVRKDGTFAKPPTYLRARSFREERSWAVVDGPCKPFPGICDHSVLPPSFQPLDEKIWPRLCTYALIDKSGTILSENRFVDVGDFSGGLAAVYVGDKWGYVDTSGAMVIEPKFDHATAFSEGLAMVMVRAARAQEVRYGFVDRSGAFVISPQFSYAEPFSEGVAVVGNDQSYWYVDRAGQNVFQARYPLAGSFVNGLAHVKTAPGNPDYQNSGTFAYINRSGKTVFTYSHQERD